MKKNLLTLTIALGTVAFGAFCQAQPPDFRGGDRDRGGPPGGFSGGGPPGGFGGGRGGFDPSSFIERLDRNGNGMIDPDEMEGPAGFMISRLQRDDPSIRTDRPIPIAKFKEAFDRMRASRESGDSGGSSGSSSGSSSSSDRGRDDNAQRLNEAMTVAPLVPGFGGNAPVLPPVLGFGPSAELLSVAVTPADTKEAEDRLARYDRDKDGFLSGDELSSRWSGNPLDFDRNGDGKLSVSELAVRAARMRVAQTEVANAQNRKEPDRRSGKDSKPAAIPDPYNGRKSFATTSRKLPDGLPGWFAERDLDGDQQVSMSEFAKSWTDTLVAEFQSFDLNGDGFITPQECLAAVRNGATALASSGSIAMSSAAPTTGPTSSSRSPAGSSSGSSGGANSSSTAPSSQTSPATGGTTATANTTPAGQPDAKTMEYVQRIMARNDKNKDGVLTADEWKDMLVDPSAADSNKDGRITALEYAQWMQSRQTK